MPCSHQELQAGGCSTSRHFRPHSTQHKGSSSQRPRQSFMAAAKGTVSKLRLCTCQHPVKGLQAHIYLSHDFLHSLQSLRIWQDKHLACSAASWTAPGASLPCLGPGRLGREGFATPTPAQCPTPLKLHVDTQTWRIPNPLLQHSLGNSE